MKGKTRLLFVSTLPARIHLMFAKIYASSLLLRSRGGKSQWWDYVLILRTKES